LPVLVFKSARNQPTVTPYVCVCVHCTSIAEAGRKQYIMIMNEIVTTTTYYTGSYYPWQKTIRWWWPSLLHRKHCRKSLGDLVTI